jgi:hypothetical protein
LLIVSTRGYVAARADAGKKSVPPVATAASPLYAGVATWRGCMTWLLRIAALLCLGWAVLLPSLSRSRPEVTATGIALADALAVANLAFAYVFWRAAGRGESDRTAVYAALLLFGLRAVNGTYQVLYVLEGPAAVVSLFDMVSSLALFVGVLNTLPGYLRRPPT